MTALPLLINLYGKSSINSSNLPVSIHRAIVQKIGGFETFLHKIQTYPVIDKEINEVEAGVVELNLQKH